MILRTILTILFFAHIFVIIQAQSDQCLTDRYADIAVFDSTDIVVENNILYGTSTNLFTNNSTNLFLDVWSPDPSIDPLAERPLILLVHGGSFMAGSRADMNFFCMEYARRGFVAATISYRLGWGCDPNAGIFTCGICGPLANNLTTAVYCAVQDAHAAMRYLVTNSVDFGIDTDWIFAGGVSAGSITALGLSFTDQAEANTYFANSVALAGNIDDAGNEWTADFQIKGVVNDCGAVFNANLIQANENIPVISFHDDLDCVVPYNTGNVLSCLGCNAFPVVSGSAVINTRLNQLGICSELNTRQLSLNHCSWPALNIVRRSSCFLKRIMCGVCTSSANNDINSSSPCALLGIEEEGACASDLNNDGLVNSGDLLILLSEYGIICQ